ncbi:MAG: glutamate--tRNA ligase, partial [Candidatus Omnitrophica bacterium]|nr:glutamate--tRNA ligase [Candidatus Omnitrophota bacterium]
GGVRTALFNFLYARAQQGKFLLRIEDTDRERSRQEFELEILDSLKWLELSWDEDIVYQSKRLDRYRDVARELVSRGLAYEEKSDGKTAIKFKMPKGEVTVHDLVHGEIKFDASLFEDLVILKSDGYPTYHFACVVDDWDMQISHVIRGDDHVSNTPRQLLLFEALGWKAPKYAHLPLILGADGIPLSKRHGAVALSSYRAEGFLPEGLLNYLALLGWGADSDQEFFRLDELIKVFSLKRIHKANPRFDRQKLEWLNSQHIKKLSESDYLARITAFYKKEVQKMPESRWKALALLYRTRIKTWEDLRNQASYCFSEVEEYPAPLYEEFFKNRSLRAHMDVWLERISELEDFNDPAKLEALTRNITQGWGIEAKDLIHPIRFALTGKTGSPGLFELMSVLGKETCIKRIKKFLTGPVK